LFLLAAACGTDSPRSEVDDDHSAVQERDAAIEVPGSGNVSQLRDGGQQDGASERDGGEREDAAQRDGAVTDGDAGDPACEASSSAHDDCNGVDDDCDGALDEDYQPMPCDGRDSDLCKDGMLMCSGQAGTRCDDDSSSVLDVCNGQDDDCDPTSADGSDEAMFGRSCDGSDGDACAEGIFACDGDALRCSDDTGTTLDVCNGQDDDCDAATADGTSEPTLGQPCDGADRDLCVEGAIACTGSSLGCSDASTDTPDVCNGADDDCDPASSDGSEDPQVGMPCDGPDSDQCVEGVYVCTNTLSCGDATSSTVETCNGDDDDCDTAIDENVDTDPSCADGAVLGAVAGDLGVEMLSAAGGGEAWKRITIREDRPSGSPLYLSASISLQSAPGTDYDLNVYCEGCGGRLAGESSAPEGELDFVDVRMEDSAGDDTFTLAVQVLFYETNQCADWQLLVEGNTEVESGPTCQ
jgi:hypothetical protein